jgi:gliding motility-associated-like protein
MAPFKSTLLALVLLLSPCLSRAQIINFCPTNIDFEQGNFFNWLCYTGNCCPIVMSSLSGPVANRHEITSGPTQDQYGLFPIVAPGGGQYSLKLGNNIVGAEAERVRYYVQVPNGLNNYSLIYRYAVVFENPGHSAPDQPRFEVKGFDSATMTPIPCATYTYVSNGFGNTGFSQSTVNTGVFYKSWTTASLNLSGWGGHTVLLEFSSGDCALSGHFGYGYVDLNCGLFNVSGNPCGLTQTTLSAPYGFQTYTWWNGNFTQQIGNTQVVTINTPPVTTTYKVVIQPQTGFGCPDTLTTTVVVTDMVFGPGNSTDTTVCPGTNLQLHVQATGTTGPYTYNWFPTTGLSCTSCQNPVVNNLQNSITYYASSTDTLGCIKLDTINITVNNFSGLNANVTNIPCYGSGNGSIVITPVGGQGPYAYQWLPTGTAGNTNTATGLAVGCYTVNVTDAMGCVRSDTICITQPPAMNLAMTGNSINCFGQNTGQASVVVTGGTPGYQYQWLPSGGTQNTASGLTGGTYTVNVTDFNGCTQSGTVNIVSPAQLTATVNPNSVQHINCFGQNTGCATVTVAGGTPPYTYFWGSNPPQYTPQACNLYAGTYTCQVTDANGCVASTSVTITQPAAPLNVAVTNTTPTSCSGSTGSVTVASTGGTPSYSYQWFPAGTAGNTSTATNLGPGMYTIVVTDNKGCKDTAYAQVNSTSSPTLTMSSTPATCFGTATGSASVIVSGGIPPYTYQWTPSGGSSSTTTPITAGNYIVTVTDQQGCVSFGNVTVTEPPAVIATISNVINVPCNGMSSGSAMVSGSGGSGSGYQYSWSTGQNSQIATGLSANTYVATVTDGTGCIDTAHVTITQPTPVVVNVLVDADATCSQNNGTITVAGSGGTPPYTYQWSNSQTGPTISNLAPGTYTVVVKDANNCVGTTAVTIQQSTALAILKDSANVSCNGLADGWASFTPAAGVAPYTYTWTGVTDNDSVATNLPAGTYTVNIMDATNCPGTATVVITEPPVLDAAISNVSQVRCFGANDGAALASATGGTAPYSYLWNTGATGANPTTMGPGSYTVVITDDHGCADSADVQITEPPLLEITGQATASSCAGMGQGSAEAVATGGTPPYSIIWATSPQQYGLTATGLNPGSYTVTVTDGNNCSKNTTITIDGFPAPVVDAGPDKIYCFGLEGIQLNATGAVTYQWSPASGLSCTACPNPVATPNATATYTVTGTDANNCIASDEVVITVYREQPTSSGSDKDICVGDVAQLNAAGGESYIWSPSESLNNATIANPVATPTATTEYSVIVVQNPCFADTLNQLVRVYGRPTVSLGPDRNELSGSTIILKADTTNAYSIVWAPPTNLSCVDCIDPTVNVERTATYIATVSNPGCAATDDININVTCDKADLFIANTFTPNNDGNNDVFFPQTPGINVMRSMMVFNRWGEKLFEAYNFPANNPAFGWDGTYKGQPLSPDTYVYMFEYICSDGTKISLKGDISLIR